MTDPHDSIPPEPPAPPAAAVGGGDLPLDWLEASYLPRGHAERRRVEAEARAAGPNAHDAFQAACSENDSLREVAAKVAVPAGLQAALLNLPDGLLASPANPSPADSATATANSAREPSSQSQPPASSPSPAEETAPLRLSTSRGRFRLRLSRRSAIAAVFLLAAFGWLGYQIDDQCGPFFRSGRNAPAFAMKVADAAPLQPAPLGDPITTTDPEQATLQLQARFTEFPPLVLEPASGYTLQAAGITELIGRRAVYATYGAGESRYTVYQLASKDLGATPADYGEHDSCNSTRIRIWPNEEMGCTWILVSAANQSIALNGY